MNTDKSSVFIHPGANVNASRIIFLITNLTLQPDQLIFLLVQNDQLIFLPIQYDQFIFLTVQYDQLTFLLSASW